MCKSMFLQISTLSAALVLSTTSWALDNGIYTIQSQYSGKLMEVENASTADGANVQQMTANGNPTQQWQITNISGDNFSVINANSGKAMEVYNFDTADGANIVQYAYWGGEPQIWTITDLGNGSFSFINSYSGKSLDLLNFDTSDGANIVQWTYWGGDPQLWSLNLVDGDDDNDNGDSGDQNTISFLSPSFSNIAVHDPSVVFANNQYYVFGSHLSVARSANMTEWSRVADGVNNNNPMFNNVTNELSEAMSWAQTDTLWAPDVAYVNGRYLMVYNACRGDSPLSAMGIASASNVEGPYSDEGVFLRSGMWGEISEDGSVYDALVHPNVVDPTVFPDNNGGLWMTYGSYSGGIFIMELNPTTGFPYAGQGYGQHLWGGNHARIEGPYVIYAPETAYYYMFVSYGGLAADGGYNIRVARSSNPNGPYVDANGTQMSHVKSNSSLPLFDDATIAPHGVKLMGNYLFSDTNNELGNVSPGHNSAYRKASTGQYFIFFHTRFPGRGEQHEVRVHEFFLNSDGWPVVSPLRYADKVDASNVNTSRTELEYVGSSEIAGTYQLINHGKDISSSIKGSSNIQLNSGSSISGGASGSWSYNQNARTISLVVNGVNYNGVVSRQWNQVRNRFEVTFSALSGDGTAIWGIKSN